MKTVSNVRIEPSRNGSRIFQFTRGTPVFVLERAVADAPQGPEENSQEEKTIQRGQTRKNQSKRTGCSSYAAPASPEKSRQYIIHGEWSGGGVQTSNR